MATQKELKIVVSDPNPILADRVCEILESDDWLSDRFEITAVMNDLRTLKTVSSQILIFDPSRHMVGGAAFHDFHSGTALVGYCSDLPTPHAMALMSEGFKAVIPKIVAAEELARIVCAVAFGGTYLHEEYTEKRALADAVPVPTSSAGLTEREREVLRQLALGNSMKEIAASLKISTKTVDTYKTRANRKLDLRSRSDIVRYAIQSGWMQGVPARIPDTRRT